jgi:copper chaperone
MKKRLATILGVIALVFAVSFAQAGTKEVKIKTNACCPDSKAAIEKALKSTEGVTEATVDLKDKVASVKFDDKKTSLDKVRKAIVKAGYNADKMKAKAAAKCDKNCKDAKAGAKCDKNCKDKKACEKPTEVK